MPLANQQLVVNDFSGGITDYTLEAQENQSATIENLIVNKNKRLDMVPGSVAFNTLFPQVPDGNTRITGLFKSVAPNLYVNAGRKIWYPGVSSWTALVGPTSNPAFSDGSSASFMAASEWNDHIYATNSDYSAPIKIYNDGTNYQVRTAGLPDLPIAPAINTSATATVTFTVLSANATAGAVYSNNNATFTVSTTIAAGTTLTTTSTGSPAPSGILTKVSGTGDTTITFTAVTAPTSNYIYAFHYFYQYSVNGTIYEDYGPVTYVARSYVPTVSPTATVAISGINFNAVANGSTFNYDSNNVKVHIYRSINNGLTLYKIGEVANGTTTFTDNFADSAITTFPLLYSNGGTLDYDPPPLSKYIHVVNGVAYYANIKTYKYNFTVTAANATIGATYTASNLTFTVLSTIAGATTLVCTTQFGTPAASGTLTKTNGVGDATITYSAVSVTAEYFKNQVRQSIVGDPDSCPSALTIDLLDEVVGISSFNDNPIVFSTKRVYRLNGQYDELGQGQVTYEDITKTVGCMSHNSIVQTRYGVFWAGDDGFYWTDGFNFKKISDTINERYKALVSSATRKSRIYATFDSVENKIHWAVTAGTSSTDNDCFFTLDLRWGISEASTFTTRVNGDSFSPTAILFYEGNLIRADRRGYVFTHNSNYTTDPKVDTTLPYASWQTAGIIPLYRSTIFNFGLPQVRKWVPKMLLTMQNVTDVSVQISAINDDSSNVDNLLEIRYRGNVLWGNANAVWGQDTPSWSSFNLIEQMRRFPATSLRCSFKQLQITQSYTNIYNSDLYGISNTSSVFKTATLPAGWPTDIVGYYISFDFDNYVKQYQITAVVGSTLTYLDPSSSQPTITGAKWLIKGFPRGEIFNILSYVIYYAPISDQSYKTYRTEQDSTGANS